MAFAPRKQSKAFLTIFNNTAPLFCEEFSLEMESLQAARDSQKIRFPIRTYPRRSKTLDNPMPFIPKRNFKLNEEIAITVGKA
jgi:hypothetical protein